MTKINVVKFDPVPQLGVTELMEQTMLLLLGLYRLKQAEIVLAVIAYIQKHNFWRGTQPDWENVWQEYCLKRSHIILREGNIN